MPANLIAKGQEAWVSTVQHVLLIGWVSLLVLAAWIVLEVLFLNGRTFGRAGSLIGRRQWGLLALLSSAVFMFLTLSAFWGIPYLPEKKPYGVADLSVLAFVFLAANFSLFVAALSCNAFLRSTREGDPAVAARAAYNIAPFLDTLRNLPLGGAFINLFSGGSLERTLNHKKKTGEE